MKATVKTFWIVTLLILACSISGKAVNLTVVGEKLAAANSTSASLSSCSSDALNENSSQLTDIKFLWTTDVELGAKSISEICSSNHQRLRRVSEDNLLLRNIYLLLSNHENLLVHGKAKRYDSDKDPLYALTGSDYYIYTLRRILI